MKTIYTFGLKYRSPEEVLAGAAVFDVRSLPNPHKVPELRTLDGTHPWVHNYLFSFPATERLVRQILVHNYSVIAIFCYGGKHRSVAIAEELGRITGAEVVHLEKGTW